MQYSLPSFNCTLYNNKLLNEQTNNITKFSQFVLNLLQEWSWKLLCQSVFPSSSSATEGYLPHQSESEEKDEKDEEAEEEEKEEEEGEEDSASRWSA